MNAVEKYNLWLKEVPSDSKIHDELVSIAGQTDEIFSRFNADLSFGTAGLRGIMGTGSDRMNIYTVRRAALAYGSYIHDADLPDTCVIAYDTRNNSRLFSETCAVALAEQGIHVSLFSEPVPTPVLSFAVRYLHTGGGVVMTASHNPAAYNGMKCYGEDGCQQTDDPAAEVYRRLQALPPITNPAVSFEDCVNAGKIEIVYDEIMSHYYETVLKEAIGTERIPASGLKVLYTPLHGTGLKPVTTLYNRIGVDYDVLKVQSTPDGDFPTCPYPNPETEGAFAEALKMVQAEGAPEYNLIVATDPDADRMAIAVPQNGTLRRFSGNEIGCLLLDFILSTLKAENRIPASAKSIKSIVTTPMAAKIAASYGCENINVLTGFKYIGSTILSLEKQGREQEVVFSFEESCGFLKGSYVRDKDAQIAAVLICALAAKCKMDGVSVADQLELLYQKYGYYRNQVISLNLNGEAGKKRCAEFIDSLRNQPITELAGLPVSTVTDYLNGYQVTINTGEKQKIDYPASNVLSFDFDGLGMLVLRPSGTEPKLKVYCFAADVTAAAADERLAGIVAAIQQKLTDFGI